MQARQTSIDLKRNLFSETNVPSKEFRLTRPSALKENFRKSLKNTLENRRHTVKHNKDTFESKSNKHRQP